MSEPSWRVAYTCLKPAVSRGRRFCAFERIWKNAAYPISYVGGTHVGRCNTRYISVPNIPMFALNKARDKERRKENGQTQTERTNQQPDH